MTITICIGSSCHLKGAREVVEEIQRQVAARKLEDRINLTGALSALEGTITKMIFS